MDASGTQEQVGADNPCRALVIVPSSDSHDKPFRRVSGERPMASFLAQLIVDSDPALRITRSERTRTAAALYARAADGQGRRRA